MSNCETDLLLFNQVQRGKEGKVNVITKDGKNKMKAKDIRKKTVTGQCCTFVKFVIYCGVHLCGCNSAFL